MRTSGRGRWRLIILGLLFVVAGVVMVYLRSDLFLRHASMYGVKALSDRTGRPVGIAAVSRSGLGGLLVHGLAVYEEDGATPILEVPGVRVSVEPWALLRWRLHVVEVSLSGPVISLRRAADGSVNLSDVLERVLGEDDDGQAVGPPLFVRVGSIRLTDGTVRLDDASNESTVQVDGVTVASLPRALIPTGARRPLRIRTGPWRIERSGKTYLVDDTHGELVATPDGLLLENVVFRAGGSSIEATGSLTYDMQVDATLRGDIDFEDVPSVRPDSIDVLGGRLSFEGMRCTGGLGSPIFEGDFHLADLVADRFEIPSLDGHLASDLHTASIDGVRMEWAGGTLDGAIEVDLEGAGSARAGLTARDLDIVAVRMALVPEQSALEPLRGRLEGAFALQVQDGVMGSSGNWRVTNGSWHGRGLARGPLDLQHDIDGNEVALSCAYGDATFDLRGELDRRDGALRLSSSLTAPELASLAEVMGRQATGALEASGQIIGTLGEPKLAIEASWRDGTLDGFPVAGLSAKGTLVDETIALEHLRVESSGGWIDASGVIRLTDGGDVSDVDLGLRAEDFDLTPYTAVLAPSAAFTGRLSGEARVAGPVEALTGRGRVHVGDTSARGVAWSLEPLDFVADQGAFDIPRLRASVGDAWITGNAAFDGTNYSFELALEDSVDVARLAGALPVPIREHVADASGRLQFHAQGDGALDEPVVTAMVVVDDTRYRTASLGRVSADASFSEGLLRADASVSGMYAVRLDIDVSDPTNPFDATMSFTQADVLPLVRLVGTSAGPGLRAAIAEGEVNLSGTLADWRNAAAPFHFSTLRLVTEQYELANVGAIDGRFTRSGIQIDSLGLASPHPEHPFEVLVEGLIDTQGDMAFSAEAHTFDLEMVSEYLGLPVAVTGIGTYRMDVRGTAGDPVFDVRWAVPSAEVRVHPGTSPLQMSDVSGDVSYADDLLRLGDVSLKVGENLVTVGGEIPVSLSFALIIPLKEQLEGAQLSFVVQSEHGDLSWLSSLHPGLKSITGTAALRAEVAGTLGAPSITGDLTVAAEQLELARLAAPLRSVALGVRFDTVVDGDGGRELTARLEGSAGVGEGRLGIDGVLTYPIDIEMLARGVSPGPVRGSVGVRMESIRPIDALVSDASRRLPMGAVATGTVDLDVIGVDPRNWTARAELENLTVEGNDRSLSSVGLVLADYEKGAITLRRLVLGDRSQRVELSGGVSPNWDVVLEAEATNLDVGLLGGLVAGARSIQGRLSGHAHVSGTGSAPRLEADWDFQKVRVAPLELDSFRGVARYADEVLLLDEWEFLSFNNQLTVGGQVPLRVSVAADGFAIESLDRAVSVTCRSHAFDIGFISLLLPAIEEAKGIGEIDLEVGGTGLKQFIHGTVTVPDGECVLSHNGMRLDELALSLEARRGSMALREFHFQTGGARYTLDGATLAMDGLTPVRLDAEIRLVDASAEAWLAQGPDGPIGSSSVRTRLTGRVLTSVDVAGLREDEAFAASLRAPESALLEGATLSASALALTRHTTGQLHLDEFFLGAMGYSLHNRGPIEAAFEEGQLRLQGLELEHDVQADPRRRFTMRAEGTWHAGEAINLSVDGRIGTGALNEWVRTRLLSQSELEAPTVSGTFGYRVALSGTESRPEFVLTIEAAPEDRVSFNRIPIEEAQVRVTYANEVLALERGRLAAAGNTALFAGALPMRLVLLQGRLAPVAKEMHLSVDSELENLGFLPLLFPDVVRPEGTGEVHLSMGGMLGEPRYQGTVQVRDAELDIPASHLALSDVQAELHVENGIVRFESLTGGLNGGRFRVRDGAIELDQGVPRAIDVAGTLSNVLFYDPGLYQLSCDATEFRIHGPLTKVRIDGELTLLDTRYERDWHELVRENFRSQSLVKMREKARFNYPILRDMEVDIIVQAADPVVLDTGNAYVEAEANGRVVGPLTELVFVGDLNIIEGRFTYQGRDFEVTEGRITNEQLTVFDPEYEIRARTVNPLQNATIRDTQGRTHIRNVWVGLTAMGSLERPLPPDFEVTVQNAATGEDYAPTREEAFALLTFGNATLVSAISEEGLTTAAQDLVAGSVQSVAGSMLAGILGLRRLQVELDAQDIEGTRFQITKDLTERWAITYSSTFQLDQEQAVEIDYEVSRRLRVSGERNEQGRYGVDLKLEYEFR